MKECEKMRYVLIVEVIFFIVAIIYLNSYWFKRIKRRKIIKKMKVDDNVIYFIDEFKRSIQNVPEIDKAQRRTRNSIIIKFVFFLMIILTIFCPMIYTFHKLLVNEKLPKADIFYKATIVFFILGFIEVIAYFFMIRYFKNKYIENKNTLKKYILENFLKKLTYDIKWYEDIHNVTNDTFINYDKLYKKADFNQIEDDKEVETNILFRRINSPENIEFEDYLRGIYKEKYIISFSDFKKVIHDRRGKTTILSEGIFSVVEIDKNINNNIIITNNRRSVNFLKKSYMVKNMPQEFYDKFIILAKDRYMIEEKISAKTIEMIKEFYDNSKMKFDMSIKENKVFFRFNTIDTMEIRSIGDIVDDLMLKEYANIIMFVTKLSEEINNNWK